MLMNYELNKNINIFPGRVSCLSYNFSFKSNYFAKSQVGGEGGGGVGPTNIFPRFVHDMYNVQSYNVFV